jgi:cysteine desulfurase/selenocysteine lyase
VSAATPLPRDQFPVADTYHYLDHAGMAPLPRRAADAAHAFLDDFVVRGAVGFTGWEDHMEDVRTSAAELMGVPADDVAFVKNTTEGLAFVANGLAWQPGDRVLVPDREFPSTVYPWLSLQDVGMETTFVEPVGQGWTLPLEVFERELTRGPVRMVVVSWVQFARGWRTDIEALASLCHEHGALLCVDAIQGLGVVPASFAAWGVDFAAADAHKWMLGPVGTGVLYVAAGVRDQLRPLKPGWASVAHREEWTNLDLVYADSARRFEGGSQTLAMIASMGASIELLLDADVATIFGHVTALLDFLDAAVTELGCAVLSARTRDGAAGHLTFAIPGVDATHATELLEAQRIICTPRGGGLRVAPHGYNTTDDIDALVTAVAALRRTTA